MVEELPAAAVMTCGELPAKSLEGLFGGWEIDVEWVPRGQPIPGSHWGDSEAGMIGSTLYVRGDTPVHSALHEGGHLICMGPDRRRKVHTDAEGEELEECGVCVLQILLADLLPGVGRERLMRDMDTWGYSFRLGSTRAWLEHDSEDAWQWLETAGIARQRRLVEPDPGAGAARIALVSESGPGAEPTTEPGNIPVESVVG